MIETLGSGFLVQKKPSLFMIRQQSFKGRSQIQTVVPSKRPLPYKVLKVET